jgi:hypothetical protein
LQTRTEADTAFFTLFLGKETIFNTAAVIAFIGGDEYHQ